MTRHFNDLRRVHDARGPLDLFVFGLVAALAALVIVGVAAFVWPWPARAHDIWISKHAYKNPAGEWCCGAEDCGVVDPGAVHAAAGGYSVRGGVTYGSGVTGNPDDGETRRDEDLNETIPYSQALPSPDGAYWRCRRPDGSPRCFFAPPPGS